MGGLEAETQPPNLSISYEQQPLRTCCPVLYLPGFLLKIFTQFIQNSFRNFSQQFRDSFCKAFFLGFLQKFFHGVFRNFSWSHSREEILEVQSSHQNFHFLPALLLLFSKFSQFFFCFLQQFFPESLVRFTSIVSAISPGNSYKEYHRLSKELFREILEKFRYKLRDKLFEKGQNKHPESLFN